ncbi:MAG: tyrosinase family protein [Thermoanaerobaculia bacterium]
MANECGGPSSVSTGCRSGDAFGERFFLPPALAESAVGRRELPTPPWQYTDDTVMALGIVETLQASGGIDQDALASRFARKYRAEPGRGYGDRGGPLGPGERSFRQPLRASSGAFGRSGSRCEPVPEISEVATAEDSAGIFDRYVYDVESYDTCNTDENVSMRQYLEGYSRDEDRALCIIVGCQVHGLGHLYVGGDMASGGMPPNDPMFFLHHANVDRLWAMWQDRNRASSDTATDYGNPGYPDDWRGEIFNFDEVRADEMFDFRALGFTYDTTE